MKRKPHRKRLDALLVERGLAPSLQKAQAMILAGEIRVAGAPGDKPGAAVAENAAIEVTGRARKYISRGGLKLEGALADFAIDVTGAVCLDIGASTGGFTDCLLQNGAARVYAVDVSTGQLDWKLRQDPRIILIERNARELAREIPELADIVVADVSFISVTKILRPAAAIAKPGAHLLILIKPQFELPREDIGSGGIVEDTRLHDKAIAAVRKAILFAGLDFLGVHPSRLKGAEGNQEYFLHALKNA